MRTSPPPDTRPLDPARLRRYLPELLQQFVPDLAQKQVALDQPTSPQPAASWPLPGRR